MSAAGTLMEPDWRGTILSAESAVLLASFVSYSPPYYKLSDIILIMRMGTTHSEVSLFLLHFVLHVKA